MLETAIAFVRKNMRTKTIIDNGTGKRQDRTDYPVAAVREAVLNALVHRDYSIHTEGMPIQLLIIPVYLRYAGQWMPMIYENRNF